MSDHKPDIPMARPSRPPEQEAVRTTIVGGRPPGSGQPVGPIPRGIEVLVKKAAVDRAFKSLLLESRAAAAQEIGLALTPAEAAILAAIPAAQLQAIIDQTTVAPQLREAFLGRAAAVMLAALGVAVTSYAAVEEIAGATAIVLPASASSASSAQPAEAPAKPEFMLPVAGAMAYPAEQVSSGQAAPTPAQPPIKNTMSRGLMIDRPKPVPPSAESASSAQSAAPEESAKPALKVIRTREIIVAGAMVKSEEPKLPPTDSASSAQSAAPAESAKPPTSDVPAATLKPKETNVFLCDGIRPDRP